MDGQTNKNYQSITSRRNIVGSLLIVEKCSNPEENPNPTMPGLPYLPVEDNASRHRNLIEHAAQKCIYQPHLSALTMLMSTAEWKREVRYTMRDGLIKARKGYFS